MKTFNNIEEMKQFYNEETNEFYIEDNIEINFALDCSCDINAWDIKACDINAWDIKARDINAWDINACDINFYAVCFAYKTFKCKSIEGRRDNAKYFCLDSEVEIIKKESD